MPMKERLEEDLRRAMKEREAGRTRLSVLRLVKAAIRNAEIERGRALEESEVLDVLAREVRMRREVLPDYRRAGRSDLVEQMEAEIQILESYLPEPLSDEELARRVDAVIERVGARHRRDIGKVMPILMAELRGRVDGSHVRRLVEERLSKGS